MRRPTLTLTCRQCAGSFRSKSSTKGYCAYKCRRKGRKASHKTTRERKAAEREQQHVAQLAASGHFEHVERRVYSPMFD
ncbi:hypothetical protein [Mesorhizobium sp.]|uniref:hypothetical protein n=1 Tax=Mesorhizobium sp. TaxID=1871066 RepID=UPI000FE7589A|nr:hypothetical protein [Mesorhizobium sp.]RWO89543.1 MAG: hypothetical protein EOQ96_05125 [Mesorhizobium sp.]